jgi:manganese efflux pump family protein
VLLKLAGLVLPLGLDSFAVGAALGLLGPPPARRARISLLFCAFEVGMPLIGLVLGAPLGHAIGSAAGDLAIGLLIALGLFTLYDGMRDDGEQDRRIAELAEARGPRMLLLGLSISLDELAIGFALGLLHLPAGLVIGVIAVQTIVLTQLGLALGARLGARWSEGAERLAGVALMALGIVLAAEKLL